MGNSAARRWCRCPVCDGLATTTKTGVLPKHGRGPHGAVRSITCEGTGQRPSALIVHRLCPDETPGGVGPPGERILIVDVPIAEFDVHGEAALARARARRQGGKETK